MKRRKRRLFYLPGMISLIILPILFSYYAEREIYSKSKRVIPLVLADTNFAKKYPDTFKKFQGNFPPKRIYPKIKFSGETKEDLVKLDFAQIYIREILSANDSIHGLHFQFSEEAQYWTFIMALEILMIEGAKTYMPLGNDLWFYHFPPDTTIINGVCGFSVSIEPSSVVELPKKEKVLVKLKKNWESSWQIIITFSAFLLSVMILRLKQIHK